MDIEEIKEPLKREIDEQSFDEGIIIAEKDDTPKRGGEKGGRVVWRVANAVMTVFFLMATGVQFNDPDPFLWVPLYGIAATLSASLTVCPDFSNYKAWQWSYLVHAIFCVGMFIYVLVELTMAVLHPESDGSLNPLTYEEGREMAGIMITSVWLFICKQSPAIKCTPCCESKEQKRMIRYIRG